MAAGHPGRLKRFMGGFRGKPLILEDDGQRCEPREMPGESARGLCARAHAAIHVQRQAEHDGRHAVMRGDFQDFGGICREFSALERLEA